MPIRFKDKLRLDNAFWQIDDFYEDISKTQIANQVGADYGFSRNCVLNSVYFVGSLRWVFSSRYKFAPVDEFAKACRISLVSYGCVEDPDSFVEKNEYLSFLEHISDSNFITPSGMEYVRERPLSDREHFMAQLFTHKQDWDNGHKCSSVLSPGYIYFIGTIDDRFVKIGYSRNVQKRLMTLEKFCPLGVKLLCHFSGRKIDEKDLHSELREYHLHNEWFNFTPEVKELVNMLIKFDLEHASERVIFPHDAVWRWRQNQKIHESRDTKRGRR